MTATVPKKLSEALALGYKEISHGEVETAHTRLRAEFMGSDCGSLHPGDKCAEFDCVDGFKIVLYCDESGGCTRGVKIPC